jgi:hypothetical protein
MRGFQEMDWLFNVVLFVFYYWLLSWLFYNPASVVESAEGSKQAIEQQLKEVFVDEKKEQQQAMLILDEIIVAGDDDKGRVLQARKIAKNLGIKQKLNRKYKPLDVLVQEIKDKLKNEPLTVAPVILKNVVASNSA